MTADSQGFLQAGEVDSVQVSLLPCGTILQQLQYSDSIDSTKCRQFVAKRMFINISYSVKNTIDGRLALVFTSSLFREGLNIIFTFLVMFSCLDQ